MLIYFLLTGPIVYILEKCDKIINMVCPVVAGSAIVGSLWWTAVTYGAITVMQVRSLLIYIVNSEIIGMFSNFCKKYK